MTHRDLPSVPSRSVIFVANTSGRAPRDLWASICAQRSDRTRRPPRASDLRFFGKIFQILEDLRSSKIFENRACFNLDVLSVPEALVHSIRILEAPAVVLAHRWLKSQPRL